MAQVSGSYSSVTRGVSEQVQHERRIGQHGEQVNMISDPVRGTARRHGSLLQSETPFAAYTLDGYNATLADIASYKSHTFFIDGVEYVLLLRHAAKVTGSLAPVAWCYNKDTKAFLPLNLAGTDTVLDALVSGGATSVVNTGRFVFIAGNTIVPATVNTDDHGATTNSRRCAVWVRGGAYSRTFTATFKLAGGSTVVATYKTLASSYPGTLDTSSIAYSDPEYQKKVNDATAAYNSAATQWIGQAAEDIQPDNIAQKLLDAAVVGGLTGTRVGSHIVFDYTQAIVEVSVDDGGDGSLIRGVGSEISSADLVSTVHYVGKIVKVRPKNSDGADAYYLKAYPKISGATGWAEVVWREGAGLTQQIAGLLVYGTVEGEELYLASTAAGLEAMTGLENPEISPNLVGDAISSPPPAFIGKTITYLGLFQDRMVVGSGAVLTFSKPGDYLNFFRTSVLTVQDDDPVEIYALGSDDDVISHGTIYDKNLFLFGKRKQYAVPGRTPLTPKSNTIIPMSAFEDATDAAPVASGNLVFYSKPRDATAAAPSASVYQLQIGVVADSPESYEISQQLDKYLAGTPLELVALTAKPHTLFVRTAGQSNGVYVYRYVDSQGGTERLWDSWSRWEWEPSIGALAGITEYNDDLLTFTVRKGTAVDTSEKVWIAADKFTLNTSLSSRPYADSLRPMPDYTTPSASAWMHDMNPEVSTAIIAAFDSSVDEYLLGTTAAGIPDFLEAYGGGAEANMWVGIYHAAWFTPTNPFMRDRNDKAILDGRLTLGRMAFTLSESGGCHVIVSSKGRDTVALAFNGRRTGYSTAAIGRQPLISDTVSAAIGKETRDCSVSVYANTWLPCTVSAMGWRGQFFNNARRV